MKKKYLFGALLGLMLAATACGSESVPVSEDVSCYNRGAYETDEGSSDSESVSDYETDEGDSDSESVPISEDVSGYYPPDYAMEGGESDPAVHGTFCGKDFVTEEFEIENGKYTEFASGVSVQHFIDNSISYEPRIEEYVTGEKYVVYTFDGEDTSITFNFRKGSVPSSYGEQCSFPSFDDGLENYYIETYRIKNVENCADDIHWGNCTKDSSPEDFEAEFGASMLPDWTPDGEQHLVYASQTHYTEFHFVDGVLHGVSCETLWNYGFQY